MKFVTDQQVADLHEKLMARDGGLPGYREDASLGAILERVRNQIRFGGSNSAERIAAMSTFALAIGRPFNDGNRRTALACGLVVLGANGSGTEPDSAHLCKLIVAASSGAIDQDAFIRDYLALLQAGSRQHQGRRNASS